MDHLQQKFDDSDVIFKDSDFFDPMAILQSLVNQGVPEDGMPILRFVEKYFADCDPETLTDRSLLFEVGIKYENELTSWRIRKNRPALPIPKPSATRNFRADC